MVELSQQKSAFVPISNKSKQALAKQIAENLYTEPEQTEQQFQLDISKLKSMRREKERVRSVISNQISNHHARDSIDSQIPIEGVLGKGGQVGIQRASIGSAGQYDPHPNLFAKTTKNKQNRIKVQTGFSQPNFGATGLQQVGNSPVDPSIKQAYQKFKYDVSTMRRGESNDYDLEAVGITNTDNSIIHNQSFASKHYARSRTNEQIRKLDTRIYADDVLRQFTKEEFGQSDINSDLNGKPQLKNNKLVPFNISMIEKCSAPPTPTPVESHEEKHRAQNQQRTNDASKQKQKLLLQELQVYANQIANSHIEAPPNTQSPSPSSAFQNLSSKTTKGTRTNIFGTQPTLMKGQGAKKPFKQPVYTNPKEMSERSRMRLFGSKRSPTGNFKKSISDHPSDKFVLMDVPIARLNRKQAERDVNEQIVYLMEAYIKQSKAGADAEDSIYPEQTSVHAQKNKVFASNLLKGLKMHGLDKAVTQRFLKRFITPYGSTQKTTQRPKMLPMGLPPSLAEASINKSQMHEQVSTEIGSLYQSQALKTEAEAIIMTDRPLEMIGQQHKKDEQQIIDLQTDSGCESEQKIKDELSDESPGILKAAKQKSIQKKGESPKKSSTFDKKELQQQQQATFGSVQSDGVIKQQSHNIGNIYNSFQSNVSIHDCIYVDSVESHQSPSRSPKRDLVFSQPSQSQPDNKKAPNHLAIINGSQSQEGSILIISDEVTHGILDKTAEQQSSLVTVDQRASNDALSPSEAMAELMKIDGSPIKEKEEQQQPPSPVSRISIQSRRSEIRKQAGMTATTHFLAQSNTKPFTINEEVLHKVPQIQPENNSKDPRMRLTSDFINSTPIILEEETGKTRPIVKRNEQTSKTQGDTMANRSKSFPHKYNIDLRAHINFFNVGESQGDSSAIENRSILNQENNMSPEPRAGKRSSQDQIRSSQMGKDHKQNRSSLQGYVFNLPIEDKRMILNQPASQKSNNDQEQIDIPERRSKMAKTAKEWPHCQRIKKQNWRKEIMQQRKSILGLSQLKPSSELKKKAIQNLRLSQEHTKSVMNQRNKIADLYLTKANQDKTSSDSPLQKHNTTFYDFKSTPKLEDYTQNALPVLPNIGALPKTNYSRFRAKPHHRASLNYAKQMSRSSNGMQKSSTTTPTGRQTHVGDALQQPSYVDSQNTHQISTDPITARQLSVSSRDIADDLLQFQAIQLSATNISKNRRYQSQTQWVLKSQDKDAKSKKGKATQQDKSAVTASNSKRNTQYRPGKTSGLLSSGVGSVTTSQLTSIHNPPLKPIGSPPIDQKQKDSSLLLDIQISKKAILPLKDRHKANNSPTAPGSEINFLAELGLGAAAVKKVAGEHHSGSHGKMMAFQVATFSVPTQEKNGQILNQMMMGLMPGSPSSEEGSSKRDRVWPEPNMAIESNPTKQKHNIKVLSSIPSPSFPLNKNSVQLSCQTGIAKSNDISPKIGSDSMMHNQQHSQEGSQQQDSAEASSQLNVPDVPLSATGNIVTIGLQKASFASAEEYQKLMIPQVLNLDMLDSLGAQVFQADNQQTEGTEERAGSLAQEEDLAVASKTKDKLASPPAIPSSGKPRPNVFFERQKMSGEPHCDTALLRADSGKLSRGGPF